MPRTASARWSHAYLLAGVLAIGCYVLAPGVAGSAWLFELVGLSAAAAIAVGIAWYRPRPVLPWVLFLVAQVVFVAGDFFYYTYDLSFPAPADGLYIAYYPLQVAGLLLLIRSRSPGRDSASLLDALIIAVGFGLLSWIYLIAPYAHHTDDAGLVSSFVSMAYPTMDVLLLAVAVRLVLGGGNRTRTFQLLTASIVCLIVTDVVYGAIELQGSYSLGSALDVGWMVTYVLWGAGALHPSMRELSSRAPSAAPSLGGVRVVLLATATLVAPAMLVANSLWPIAGFDVPIAAAASAALFGLVLTRTLGLVSSLREAVSRLERAERRERVLRRAATALTAAPDRARIAQAATNGVNELMRGVPGVHVAVQLSDGTVTSLPRSAASESVVVPLSTQAADYGRLVVTSPVPAQAEVVVGLQTLAAQVALALESVALTEGLSRQRSEARVGALVQNSSDVIMVLDAGLVVRYVTPSVSRVLGHRAEELVDTPFHLLLGPADQVAAADLFSELVAHSPESARAEWQVRCGDGRLTDVETVSIDLLDHPGVNGIVVTLRDITERKELQAGLQHHIHELEELDRIRSEFVATVSHELRTPLTSIIGEVELLEDGVYGDLSGEQAQRLEVVGRNGARLLRLIEDLLTLSHIETSALNLHREPTLVAGLLDGVFSQVERIAAAKQIELTLTCCPTAETVLVDREHLDRALLNLLTNAIKFTPAGGTVHLQARREAEDLVITVADTGVGIPENEQAGLFTRFFRSSVATRLAIQGTGLGLVIVKRIVEEHGGTISLVSALDVGTTVTLRIPAMPPEVRADAA